MFFTTSGSCSLADDVVAEVNAQQRLRRNMIKESLARHLRKRCIDERGLAVDKKVYRERDGKPFLIVKITSVYCLHLLPLAADGRVIPNTKPLSYSPDMFELLK